MDGHAAQVCAANRGIRQYLWEKCSRIRIENDEVGARARTDHSPLVGSLVCKCLVGNRSRISVERAFDVEDLFGSPPAVGLTVIGLSAHGNGETLERRP